MVEAKHVSGKNIYWSTFIGGSKERNIFDFLHCPFDPPAKQHRPVSQLGWILWCMLARPSKGQCRNSKNSPPLLLAVKVDQNIFFPETCFASTFLSLNSRCDYLFFSSLSLKFYILNDSVDHPYRTSFPPWWRRSFQHTLCESHYAFMRTAETDFVAPNKIRKKCGKH